MSRGYKNDLPNALRIRQGARSEVVGDIARLLGQLPQRVGQRASRRGDSGQGRSLGGQPQDICRNAGCEGGGNLRLVLGIGMLRADPAKRAWLGEIW